MFVSQEIDRGRLPVVLLSGFLGSGKTTLVNALLRDPRLADTAVAVNEFGEVPLDHHLIDQGQDRTVIMANGCLCCNLAGDLEDAVMRVFSRRQAGELPTFKRLIVEPSGLADPAPIAQAILRNPVMSRVLRLEAIVTTVDVMFAEAQLPRHPESRKQVSLADTLVLTKTDLADPSAALRVKSLLVNLNPQARLLEATHGAVDAASLFPESFFDPAVPAAPWSPLAIQPADHDHANHTDRTVAVSLIAGAPLEWRAFDIWLRGIRITHGEDLLRLKGFLNVADAHGPLVIQGVHHVVHPPVALDTWPDADRRTRIVAIATESAAAAIETSWNEALPGLIAAARAA
jgi:G3E family GTPase